jgi:hypothetical protein
MNHLSITSWHMAEAQGVRIIKSMVLVETTPEGKQRGHSMQYNEETRATEYSVYDIDASGAQRVWPMITESPLAELAATNVAPPPRQT